MNSVYYNKCYEELDIINGVERGKLIQHDFHVTAWRWEQFRRLGWVK